MAGGGSYEEITESSGDISFVVDVMCAWGHVRYSDAAIGRTSSLGSGREANSRGDAAIGRANCSLPRRIGFTDTRRSNLSHRNCSSRSLGARALEPQGEDLANAVDQQSWDPSIKALTQFPSVLANMDKNLSWTSALGEAYVNQQEAVMDAVQVMRARAKTAGNLESNKQVKVVTEGPTIVVEPADPEVVYVPAYDPWIVYGAPVVGWPGWYPYPGLYVAGPGVSFGVGFAVGLFAGFAWGSHGWGCDWGHRTVVFNHNTFISNSKTFYGGHQGFHDFGAARGYQGFHNSGAGRGYEGSRGRDIRGSGVHGGTAERGPSESHAEAGTHSGAFGGYDHGGTTRSYSDRGNSSLHGGGFHGGGFGGRH
jgi:hypothetical protein